jgi:predicted DNA-binding protein (UPF0251 family)
MADMVSKGRGASGERHHFRKHPELVLRGDDNPSRKHPERLARGDANGARLHPERLARGSRSSRTKLNERQVAEIRGVYAAGGVTRKELGMSYDVSLGVIHLIVHGKTWKHINPAHSSSIHPELILRCPKSPNVHLTDDDIRAIRRMSAAGVKQADIATKFGIVQSNVSMIVHRKTWAHIPEEVEAA